MSTQQYITGPQIASLMRRYRVTIRDLSLRMQITQKRIRQVRSCGLNHPELARDWIQAIIGDDPGPFPDIYLLLTRQKRE